MNSFFNFASALQYFILQVIVIIGEIDCREGIITALERDYYETFEQAVQSTLDLFVPILKSMVSVRKFKVRWCIILVLLFVDVIVVFCFV